MTTKITIHAHDGWPVQVINRAGGPNSNAELHTLAPGEMRDFHTNGNELVVKELGGVRPADIRDPSDPRPVMREEPDRQEQSADEPTAEEFHEEHRDHVDHD
jgi:hypothetical protein